MPNRQYAKSELQPQAAWGDRSACAMQEDAVAATLFAAGLACAAPLADLPKLTDDRHNGADRVRPKKILA